MLKKKTILEVNKIYSEQNPSVYLNNLNSKKIELFVNNTKSFFLKKLQLPPRIFQNSSLLDLGCGSGQSTIFYDWNGANCTLVEYDRKSFLNAKSLFSLCWKARIIAFHSSSVRLNEGILTCRFGLIIDGL